MLLFIPGAQTLKDKRQVLQSIIVRIRKFNVSVAEVGEQEQWQRADLGIAFVGCNDSYLDSIQQKMVDLIEGQYPVEITEITVNEY